MNFLKFIRDRSSARVSKEGAVDSPNKIMIPDDWLSKKITVEEAEADNPGITDDRVSRFPLAARPFGFLNRQWEILKSEIKPRDELWSFISPGDSWQWFTGRMGVALLRDGKVIGVIVTEMN